VTTVDEILAAECPAFGRAVCAITAMPAHCARSSPATLPRAVGVAASRAAQATYYATVGRELASHESVDHSREQWARDNVTTNTCEGSFSLLKRGAKGIYQQCGEQHLRRYLAEFDFRYYTRTKVGLTDYMAAEEAAKGIIGKRLTYRRPESKESTDAR
jgi:hypothetical protein